MQLNDVAAGRGRGALRGVVLQTAMRILTSLAAFLLHTLFPSSMLATKIILTRRLKRTARPVAAVLAQDVAEILARGVPTGHAE